MTQEQLNQAFYESLGWRCTNEGWVNPDNAEECLPDLTIDTVRNAVMGLTKEKLAVFNHHLSQAEKQWVRTLPELTESDWRDCYLKTIGKI